MGHDTGSTDEGRSVARIDYRTVAEAGPAVIERWPPLAVFLDDPS